MKSIAILGAYGALGAELLAQALVSDSFDRVFVLDEMGDPAIEQDIRGFLASRGVEENRAPVWQRLSPSEHALGMTQHEREALLGGSLTVFVAPHRPVSRMTAGRIRYIATSGLRQLSSLLKDCDAEINYLSSHMVAGDRMGAFTEYDIDCGQRARNAHEYAAMIGEAEARALFAKERLKIFRLPFLSGAEDDGRIFDAGSEFSAIMRGLKGDNGRIYANPAAIVPVAPVDRVVQHVLAIASSPGCDGTYHLRGCGMQVEDLCRLLGVAQAGFRSLAAYRLHAALGRKGVGARTKAFALAAPLEAVDYLYPQVHHDAYRYEMVVARLGLPSIFEGPAMRVTAARDAAQQTRYDSALCAYAETGTVGVLDRDPAWERITVIDDISLPYLDTGQGTPIVFLSGALGPEYWLGTMRYLAGRYRCILMGTIGWSATQPNNGSYAGHEEQAGLVKGLLAHLDIRDACHFVATDVATPVMQYFASRWPEKIASLQLINPVTAPREMARCLPASLCSRIASDKGVAKLIIELQKSEAELRKASAFDMLIANRERAVSERWSRLRSNIAADKVRLGLFCAALRERLSTHDLPRVSEMKCATRVLWFCGNPVGDLALYARASTESASGRDVVVVADAGMDAAEAQPVMVGDLIVDHIRSLEASTAGTRSAAADTIRDTRKLKPPPMPSHDASAVERVREVAHG